MVGGVDVPRCSLIGKQLEVEARGEEVTTRSLWSSRVLLACGDRSPGVVTGEGSSSRSGLGKDSRSESKLLRDCGWRVVLE